MFLLTTSLWRLLKPGYMASRTAELYNYPGLIFFFILICSVITYPLIVVGSLHKILNKIENLEQLIKK